MIHTNRCKHCGKTKEEHWYEYCDQESMMTEFTDSGIAALDANKEELYDSMLELKPFIDAVLSNPQFGETVYAYNHHRITLSMLKKIHAILNQIEKEK